MRTFSEMDKHYDRHWEVTETIDEVIALIDECRNTDKKGDIR